jgi:glutathione synthase/RimK-type ligase-like ATP-grasp enzyme
MKFLILHDDIHLLIHEVQAHLESSGHSVVLTSLGEFSFHSRRVSEFQKYDGIFLDRPQESNPFFWQQIQLLSSFSFQSKIMNNPAAYAMFRNKATGSIWLKENGFAIPETFMTANLNEAKNWIKETHWKDILCKPLYGHSGLGIFGFSKEQAPFKRFEELLKSQGLLYFQEFISTKPVQDLRVEMIGDQIVDCFLRQQDQISAYPLCNIAQGARPVRTRISDALAKDLKRLMKTSGLTIAGIDLIWSDKQNQYLVVEVNPEPNTCDWQPQFSKALAQALVQQAQNTKKDKNHDQNFQPL